MTELEKQSLYYLDLILWVMLQPDITQFADVIYDARDFRDRLVRERIKP